MNERFGKRHGYESPTPEIRVRENAPLELRSVLVDIAYESGLRPSQLRQIVCKVLRVAADPNNWSEYPNMDQELRWDLSECEWYLIYDVIEEVQESLLELSDSNPDGFEKEINRYFQLRGIGWELIDGRVEVRGPESFKNTVGGAIDALAGTKRNTAHTELVEALADLSRRPNADITGAIQHAMAALECVARDIVGKPNATLGKIMKENPNLLPKPLNQAVEKAWGYASESGRHLREGKSPDFAEAEFIVNISGAVCIYLLDKWTTNTTLTNN